MVVEGFKLFVETEVWDISSALLVDGFMIGFWMTVLVELIVDEAALALSANVAK